MTLEQAASRIAELNRQEGHAAFEIGDIALVVAPIGQNGVRTDADTRLQELAERSGVPVDSLRQRRYVSSRIPPGSRLPAVAWSTYQTLAGISDKGERAEWIKRVNAKPKQWVRSDLRVALGQKVPEAAPVTSARLVEEIKAKPEMARAVWQDPAARQAIQEAAINSVPGPREPHVTRRAYADAIAEAASDDAVGAWLAVAVKMARLRADFEATDLGRQIARHQRAREYVRMLQEDVEYLSSVLTQADKRIRVPEVVS